MAVLESKLDVRATPYQQNRADTLEMLGVLDELHAEAGRGGGKAAIDRLRARGKMPIRERIAHVLDRDSPFMEISPLAAWRSDYPVGSGFVVGIGVFGELQSLRRIQRRSGPG